MKRARVLKTVVNLLLVLAILTALWSGMGLPLTRRLEYRRMERAMLLEPMEILWCGDEGEVLSVNDEYLGLYTGDWFGYPMSLNEMHLFPLEDGVGHAMRKHFFFGVDIWAYEASGTAVRADLDLEVRRGEQKDQTRLTAPLQDGMFLFSVQRYEAGANSWQEDAMEDMVWHEMGENMRHESSYKMTITFYDEAGNVTATQESGGTYNENR